MGKPKRSDQSLAVYGVLALAIVGLVGYIVLIALGRDAPDALLTGVVGVALGGVLGWARGGTYYQPDREVVPAPEVLPEIPPMTGPTGPDHGTFG
jgi:tetrahydromethanopterin S-methyltransferase subunit E